MATNDNERGDSYQRLQRLQQASAAVNAALGPDAEYDAWERTGRVRQGPDVPAYVEAGDGELTPEENAEWWRQHAERQKRIDEIYERHPPQSRKREPAAVMRAVVCAACQHGDHDERAAGSGERCVCLCHGQLPPPCPVCASPATHKPSHNGSARCQSGSPASGGRNVHCSCSICF